MKISEFFKLCDVDYTKMLYDDPKDVSHLKFKIKSFDFETKQICYANVLKIVRKPATKQYVLNATQSEVKVSPLHSFYVKIESSKPHWVEATALLDVKNFEVFDGKEWTAASIHLVDEMMDVLDIEVEKNHNYFSNGILSHNTIYGDPTTTSGGMAIPFHASTRIQLIGGSKIEKNGELIGINVEAKLIKNKVAAPFRRASFQIIFGVGLKDHEEMFDVLREYCDAHGPQEINGEFVAISGKGAWKSFTTATSLKDHEDEKFSHEKKFYKEKFNELWTDEKYKEKLELLLEIALVKSPAQAERDIKKAALESQNASDVQVTK